MATDKCTQNIEEMLQKLQLPSHATGDVRPKKKLERTSSFPPHQHFRSGPSELEGNGAFLDHHDLQHYHSKNDGDKCDNHTSDQADFSRMPTELLRSPVEGGGKKSRREKERANSRHHTNCLHNRHHSSHGRKMRERSRSDSVRDPRSHVDTSLDDDCPGVNRHRRPRAHQHQHFVCKHCIEQLGPGGVSREKQTKKGWSRKHSPENVHSSSSGGEHTITDPVVVMTLEDMRTATLLLDRSTELGELGDESGNDTFVGGYDNHREADARTAHYHHHYSCSGGPGGPPNGKPNLKKKNCMHISNSPTTNGLYRPDEASNRLEDVDWPRLPILSGRSGRDSPSTDMAVACLDMNSPRMKRLLEVKQQQQHRFKGLQEEGEVRHTYFHNHQHYHHIIHHNQP